MHHETLKDKYDHGEADEMIRECGFNLPIGQWMSFVRVPVRLLLRADLDGTLPIMARDFDSMGLFLFTLRNGRLADLRRGGGMCYAEKLLISRQDQLSPMHTLIKAEDILTVAVPV